MGAAKAIAGFLSICWQQNMANKAPAADGSKLSTSKLVNPGPAMSAKST